MRAPVACEVGNAVARVTLDRPEAANALSFETVGLLTESLAAAVADPSTRLVRLSAEGNAFCSGVDLKSVKLSDPDQASRYAAALSELYGRLLTLPLPLLCSVNGPVIGGGLGLAAAADLVWAGPRARFSLPETRIGFVPALVSVVLRRRMSPVQLSGLALSGITLDPSHALAAGLVDFLAESAAAEEADALTLRLLCEHSRGALRRTKVFLVERHTQGLELELADAQREFRMAAASEDVRRALAAFRRKESVRWDEG